MAYWAAILVLCMCTHTAATSINPRADTKHCLQPLFGHEGSSLTIVDCNNSSWQKWTLDNKQVRLANGMCLDMTDGKAFDGAKPQVWNCFYNNDNQKWIMRGTMLNLYNSNKCLTGGNAHVNTALQISTCDSKDTGQMWTTNASLIPVATHKPSTTILLGETFGDVQAWLSSADLSIHLERQANIVLDSGNSNNLPTVLLDPTRKKQPIEGFGASLTDSSAYLINQKMTPHQVDNLMVQLFDSTQGIGLSMLRQPMGASDFSHIGSYSYNDGANDPTLSRFSIAHDKVDIIPLLRLAFSINNKLKILALPWSPPAWMKTSASLNGGSLARNAFDPLARYFVKFIQAYAAQGLPIWAVSPQNEPQFSSSSYPSMLLSAADEISFVSNNLAPALTHAKLATKILGFDHNACEQTTGQCPAVYPASVLENSASAHGIGGIAWHCYNGDLSHITQFHDRFPSTPLYFTECSGGGWQDENPSYLHAELWLLFSTMNNWMRTAITWNLALDPTGGPTNGGCKNCRGVVTINPNDGAVTYNAEFYALGHLSKFWRQGAYVVTVNSGVANLNTAAYQNINGQNVLLVENTSGSSSSFWVQCNNHGFIATVPAGAAVTYAWMLPAVS